MTMNTEVLNLKDKIGVLREGKKGEERKRQRQREKEKKKS